MKKSDTLAPYPGSHSMPRWTLGELPEAPVFQWKNILAMIGPGLVMGAAAIGGGEWTLGPKVTAQYGGVILWLATISILFQVFYNIEICRYTIYSGEPIFTGKFRLLPGPWFWLIAYLCVDWGSFFPYLVTNAAIPVYALITGETFPKDPSSAQWWMHKTISLSLFCLMLLPLIFGGKVYNSLKAVMSFKLIYVLGLLLFLGIFYAHGENWWNIVSGFWQFGSLPVKVPEGEAPQVTNFLTTAFWSERPPLDMSIIALMCALAAIAGNGGLTNAPISNFVRDQGWGMGRHVGAIPSVVGGQGIELSHEGCVFVPDEKSMPRWRGWMRHLIREQLAVWLPACLIGVALPSILSVEFLARGTKADNPWNLAVLTAQAVGDHIEHPVEGTLAQTIGLAPALASPAMGALFVKLVLFCGMIVLLTSGITTADGFIRRWVDLIWVGLPRLRQMETHAVKYVYFGVLSFYFVVGFTMLCLPSPPEDVTKIATTGYNFALGFSSIHALAVNLLLLPKELRPNWFSRVMLVLSGLFFTFLGTMGALALAKVI